MLFEAGHVIDGKYRLVRLIGTGGMGSVYEGENLLIRRRVAIKILHAASTGNVDAIRRFEREAQAAGEIGNDHILEVLDLGSLPTGDRYMVMEYLDGETLAARIERHGRLTPGQIAPIARQFLTALASAHAAGIIHRDLKPENIFILRAKAGRVDFVKLIDFGISKFSRPFSEGEHRMTRADAVLGTPCYMSPEQARGARETDVRSDIYSCGVILYESVTGRLPFEGESFNDLMFKIALSDAPSPLSFVPSLDPDFAWLINHAIARDPESRFASAQEFAEALDEWMRKNALTETLSLPLPSDAFPARAEPTRRARRPPTSGAARSECRGSPRHLSAGSWRSASPLRSWCAPTRRPWSLTPDPRPRCPRPRRPRNRRRWTDWQRQRETRAPRPIRWRRASHRPALPRCSTSRRGKRSRRPTRPNRPPRSPTSPSRRPRHPPRDSTSDTDRGANSRHDRLFVAPGLGRVQRCERRGDPHLGEHAAERGGRRDRLVPRIPGRPRPKGVGTHRPRRTPRRRPAHGMAAPDGD
jgi:serine/threonine protein kinase